eukprot:10040495-Heterocapsa_arctica.AAC.1
MAQSLSSAVPSLTLDLRLMMVPEASLMACLKRPSFAMALGRVWKPASWANLWSTREGKREW